jgi:hypothetical protein
MICNTRCLTTCNTKSNTSITISNYSKLSLITSLITIRSNSTITTVCTNNINILKNLIISKNSTSNTNSTSTRTITIITLSKKRNSIIKISTKSNIKNKRISTCKKGRKRINSKFISKVRSPEPFLILNKPNTSDFIYMW